MLEREPELEISGNLVDYLRAGKCTLIAGPMISLSPGERLRPPTPAWLAFEMAESLQIQPEKYDLPWVAQLYADRENPTALRNWVSPYLADVRYCPTLTHYLVAQLPFSRIVYTAQDRLLRMAHENRKVPASFFLSGGSQGYDTQRTIIQIYGSAEQPPTLKLTEDERRNVWYERNGSGVTLRNWASSEVLLILGYTVNDPELSDFYYQLRPEYSGNIPPAYLVGPGASADYVKFWHKHNAVLYSLDPATFLQKLANKLDIPLDLTCEEPPLPSLEERQKRERLRARFEYLSGLNQWVETPGELRRPFPPYFVIQMRAGLVNPGTGSEADIPAPATSEWEESTALNQIQLGNIEWSQGNLELAKVYFYEAIRRNPRLADAYLSLFHLLVERRELDEACQVYQQLTQKAPQQAFLPERFQVRKILGQIDLGVSYCVYDQEQAQLVTATILRRAFTVQEEALAKFVRQMSDLSSPRISRILGYDRHRGRHYMLSEYVEGQLLQDRLRPGKPLPYLEAMQIAGQVAEALEDGHRQGALHLDLQPDNIVLAAQGAVLVNYGYSRLARLVQSSGRLTQADHHDYLSPEQLAGEEEGKASDIYALGTILYEMLTGHTPGIGSFQPPSEVNVQVTEAVDVLVDHARERYPARRYASAAEMRKEINRITLVSLKGNFNQYLRIGLAKVSHIYEQVITGKALLVLLPVLAILLAVSLIPAIPDGVAFVARILFPLLLNSLIVSVFTDWAVRAIAKWRGLGSLISSGRGMGVILGLVFTIFLIADLGFDIIFGDTSSQMLSDFGAMLAIVLFLTAVALGIILLASRSAERWWKRYTSGFYWSFLALVFITLLMTLLGWPCGLIGPVCN